MQKHAAPIIAAVLLLLVLYVGSYFALVQQGLAISSRSECSAEFRIAGDAVAWFYYPIHQIDRKMRRWVWGSHRERMRMSPWERIWLDDSVHAP